MSINGHDAKAVKHSLSAVVRAAESVLGDRGVRQAALALERTIKRKLSQRGTGRLYRRGKKTHRASAPGQPPAVDTGRLRSSVGHERRGLLEYRVGAGVDYAPILEYGSAKRGFAHIERTAQQMAAGKRRTGFLAPRPFMRPSLSEAKAEMTKGIQAELLDLPLQRRAR